MLDAAAGAAYTVEISALQAYQGKLLGIMDSMVAQSVALGMSTAAAGSSDAGLGNFPEAQSLAGAYQSSMQSLMTNFEEITQLVNTMTDVLGTAGKNYAETEQQLTDQFNQIVAEYAGKSGSFTTPASPGASAPYSPGSDSYGGYGSGSASTTTSPNASATGTGTGTGTVYQNQTNSSSTTDSSTPSTATTGPSYTMTPGDSSTSDTDNTGT